MKIVVLSDICLVRATKCEKTEPQTSKHTSLNFEDSVVFSLICPLDGGRDLLKHWRAKNNLFQNDSEVHCSLCGQ